MLFALTLPALAAEPEVLSIRIGIAPAELATIEVPLTPGVTSHRVRSGVELDVTVSILRTADGDLTATWAMVPRSHRVRGLEGVDRQLAQLVVDTGTWPLAATLSIDEVPGRTWEYEGGGELHDRWYGVRAVVGPAS